MPNYRTQDPYARIPLNQLARINQNDPWFGLGYALAQGWNHQYNQRGIDKGIKAGEEIIEGIDNSVLKEKSQPASDDLYNSAISAGALTNRNNPYSERDYKEEATRAVLGNNGIVMNSAGNMDLTKRPIKINNDGSASTVRSASINDNGKEVLIPTIGPNGEDLDIEQAVGLYRRTGQNLGRYNSVEEANQAAQNIHDSEQRRLGQQGPTKEQLKQNKLAYFVDKYSGSPNPDGDATAARSIATAAEQNLQRINSLAGFDKMQVRQQIMDRLIADGRPSVQRDEIMRQLDPVLDAKEKSVNDELFNFYNRAYQDRVAAGDYEGAQMLVPRMARYNADLAGVAVAGVPTIRDMYNEANKREDAATKHSYNKEMAGIRAQNTKDILAYKNNMEFSNRYRGLKALYPNLDDSVIAGMAYSGYKPGSSSGSGSGGVSASTQLSAAKDIMRRGDEWVQNSGKPITEWENYDQYQQASNTIDGIAGFDPEAAKSNPNYNAGMKELTDVLMNPNKPPRAAIERALKAKYGDLADKMIADADWDAFYGDNTEKREVTTGVYDSSRTAGGFR